jgi:hypothetical protein
MAKSKTKLPEPFSPEVCERIRRLQKYITDCEDARNHAFTQRDQLLTEIVDCDDEESVRDMKCRRNDAFDEIERLKKSISWATAELKKAIEKAEDVELFETTEIEIPDFQQRLLDKAKKNVGIETDDEKAKRETKEREAREKGRDPNQEDLPLDGGSSSSDDSVENYLPGRWKDQNGEEEDVLDFRRIQDLAFSNGADTEIVPRFSASWGCSVDFVLNGSTVGSLKYSGPIPEGKPKRRSSRSKGG